MKSEIRSSPEYGTVLVLTSETEEEAQVLKELWDRKAELESIEIKAFRREVDMDDRTRTHIREMEANARFPTGVGKIDRGECPTGAIYPMACMFCPFGHMLECHHPYTCEEVECSHYKQAELDDGLS